MSTGITGLLVVGGSVLVSIGGLIAVRRLINAELMQAHHDVAAAIFGLIGTIYAVLLAFAVIIVWGSFTSTKETVSQEANALADVERMSRGFEVPVRRQVQEAARTYARLVIQDEWAAMADGNSSPLANAALVELWHVYTDMGPSQRDNVLYPESITRLNQLSENRRLRILASHAHVPFIIWSLLLSGGVVMVLFSYLFGVQNLWSRVMMTACLSGIISLTLFLIVALNGPFSGDVHVNAEPFQLVLQQMQHLER